jgi:hypothetical protein
MRSMNLVQVVLYVRESHQQLIKRVEFLWDRMSNMLMRGCWCDIIFRNVLAPTWDKIDDMKNSSYEELERVFNKFLKYHMKILSDFNAKIDREDIFKPTLGNETLDEISNDNGVRIVKFAQIQKSNCQKYNVPTS